MLNNYIKATYWVYQEGIPDLYARACKLKHEFNFEAYSHELVKWGLWRLTWRMIYLVEKWFVCKWRKQDTIGHRRSLKCVQSRAAPDNIYAKEDERWCLRRFLYQDVGRCTWIKPSGLVYMGNNDRKAWIGA